MKNTLVVHAVLLVGLGASVAMAQPGGAAQQRFIQEAASGGVAEISLSRLALERTTDSSVKELASTLVTEHLALNTALDAMCQRRSLAVPTSLMSDAGQKSYDVLQKLTGSKFDHEYLRLLLVNHRKTIVLFQGQAKRGQDPELAQWAATTLPLLKHHLRLAQAVDDEMRKNERTITSQ